MTMDPTLLACVLLPLLLLLHLHRGRRNHGKPSLPLPPGPRGFPILGALPLLGSMPHSSLAKLASRYGPIMYLKMGTCGVVVASTPDAARAFLKNLDAQYAFRPNVISAKDITYDRQEIIFGDYGPLWKLLRKLSTLHLLSNKAMSSWASVRRAESRHVVRSVCNSAEVGSPVLLPEVLVCAMANIIGQITVSRRVFDSHGKESNEFKNMILEMLTGGGLFNIGDFIPSIAWMDLQGIQGKQRRVHERYDAMVTRMVKEHAATAHEREGRPDFLDLIMANKDGEDGETLSDIHIKGLIFDMFTAGTDTSSIIIEWAMAEMFRNPTILKHVQSEMDAVVGQDRLLEESDLPNLPYLQALCKEAFRLHPSTPLSLPHYSYEECEVGGYYIPKNTRLLINVWAIGRDPNVWDNPLEFDPQRFLSGKGAKIEPHGNDFELIPFGAGRRICIGKQAGIMFVQYFLGILVQAFDWKLPEGEELNMEESAGLVLPKAKPISAFATPRLAPAAYL